MATPPLPIPSAPKRAPPVPLTQQELLQNFTVLVQRAAEAHNQLVDQVKRSQNEQEALQRSLKQLQDILTPSKVE